MQRKEHVEAFWGEYNRNNLLKPVFIFLKYKICILHSLFL